MWEFLARSLEASTIFTFAALGELIGQRSGILNVGIEGVMLFGATLGFIAAQSTGSYWLGFLVGIAIGGSARPSPRILFHHAGGRPGCERDGHLDPRLRPHHLHRQPIHRTFGDGEDTHHLGSFPLLLSRNRAGSHHLVRALQDEPGAEDKIGGRESIGRGSFGDKRHQNSLSLCDSRLGCSWGWRVRSTLWITTRSGTITFSWAGVSSPWRSSFSPCGILSSCSAVPCSLEPCGSSHSTRNWYSPAFLSRYIWRTVPFVITLGVLLLMSTKWFRAQVGRSKT